VLGPQHQFTPRERNPDDLFRLGILALRAERGGDQIQRQNEFFIRRRPPVALAQYLGDLPDQVIGRAVRESRRRCAERQRGEQYQGWCGA